jgi:hypothetical protein
MSDNFRQKITKAISDEVCDVTGFPNITAGDKSLVPFLVDRICLEVSKLAEGMGQLGSEVLEQYEGHGGEIWAYLDGASTKKIQCQAFIRKELK